MDFLLRRFFINFVFQRQNTNLILLICASILGGLIGFSGVKTIEQVGEIELTKKEETSIIVSATGFSALSMLLIIRIFNLDINLYIKRKREIRKLAEDLLQDQGMSAAEEALLLLADASVTPLKDSGIPGDNQIYSILKSIRSDLHEVIREIFSIIKRDIISDHNYNNQLCDIDFLERLLVNLCSIYKEDKIDNYNFFNFLPWEKRKRIRRVIDNFRTQYNINLKRIETVDVEHTNVQPRQIKPGEATELPRDFVSQEKTPEMEIIEDEDE